MGGARQPSSVDRVLEVLDVGLQRTATAGPGGRDLGEGFCVRCQLREPPAGADLCAGCRAFLLGDSDIDPADGNQAWRPEGAAGTLEVRGRRVRCVTLVDEAAAAARQDPNWWRRASLAALEADQSCVEDLPALVELLRLGLDPEDGR